MVLILTIVRIMEMFVLMFVLDQDDGKYRVGLKGFRQSCVHNTLLPFVFRLAFQVSTTTLALLSILACRCCEIQ
jgi:hypothetical protein